MNTLENVRVTKPMVSNDPAHVSTLSSHIHYMSYSYKEKKFKKTESTHTRGGILENIRRILKFRNK